MLPLLGEAGICRRERFLHRDRALHCIDRAAELDQRAIADKLEEAAAVPRDQGVQDLAPARLQRRKRPRLVGMHQPAVVHHVRRENRGETALGSSFGHSQAPPVVVHH